MLKQIAGYKSYATAALMLAYAAVGYFHLVASAPPLDLNTALGVVAAALSLVGIRSGLTTELAKLAPALQDVLKKTAPVLVAVALLVPLMLLSACGTLGGALVDAGASIAGPSSSSSIKAVAVLEQSYTVAAIAGTAWLKSGLATPAQAQQLETLNDAAHAELVAARTAAENGNSVTIVATYTALTQGLQAFQAFETANKIGVTP